MKKRIIEIAVSALFLTAVVITSEWGLKDAAAVDTVDTRHIVVIDPGHGGLDPGKVGHNGERESDINLSIALKLQTLLSDAGYAVVMTRTEDCGLYSENSVNKKAEDMRERCRIITEAGAEVVISIHQNSFTDTSVHGAQVFYYTHSDKGKVLAGLIQESIRNTADSGNTRKIKTNNSYYMLVHTPCPTVIVECGFLSNYEETAKLVSDDYQMKIAQAILIGIDNFWAE